MMQSDSGLAVSDTRRNEQLIDMRTEGSAGPTDEMWDAMRAAKPGWASQGEDPLVNELEAETARLLGKEKALLIPTCQMANLVAHMTLGERGTQVVMDEENHSAASEAWAIAYVVGMFPRLIASPRGILQPEAVEHEIVARSRPGIGTTLVCIENTHTRAGGTVMTPSETRAVADVAHAHGARVHLDGARIWNAAAALGVAPSVLAEPVDTVSVSLNKGLSAPFAALLAGTAETIAEARTNLVRLGGANMHRAGIYAAAGLIAIAKMRDRLVDDHRRAADLARDLIEVEGLRLVTPVIESNLVIVDVSALATAPDFAARLHEGHGIRVITTPGNPRCIRFATHRLIDDAAIEAAAHATRLVAASFQA